jgi:prepilin-type N-terminal cleavage/methylation domain-containing protein
MPTTHTIAERGFSLLEVLVATSLVAVGVAALAQLAVVSVYANLHAKQATFAAILAQQKMEALFPEAAAGALAPSPPGTLGQNAAGYCDFVDAAGRMLAGGPAPPPGATYVRRWSVDAVPGSITRTLILQVLVTDLTNRGDADSLGSLLVLPGEARIVAAKAAPVS